MKKDAEAKEVVDGLTLVVSSYLPDFRSAPTRHAPRAGAKLDFLNARADFIFERIYVELPWEVEQFPIAVQIAASYFPECPIPSGPFGYDGNLNDVLDRPLRAKLEPYWSGAGWYELEKPLRRHSPFFEFLGAAFRDNVRPILDDWSRKLLADDVLRIAAGTYNEVEASGKFDDAEAIFSRRLDRIGPTSIEGYPIGKIKKQMLFRLQGLKTWYMI